MAHANLHLAVGLGVGAAVASLPVLRALVARTPLARPLARMWLCALAVGAWALVPNLVSALGITSGLHRVVWGDVFVFHRAIDRRIDGGLLIGELLLVAQLVVHYALLVLALARTRRPA
jgi:hypothetical protein